MLAQQQQLNLTTYVQCFITLIRVNKQRLIVIIDFNAISNFITRAFVKKKEYFT